VNHGIDGSCHSCTKVIIEEEKGKKRGGEREKRRKGGKKKKEGETQKLMSECLFFRLQILVLS